MTIENRDLEPGTMLVARYKGQEHTAEVVQTETGLRYQLADGREFKSPSAAGSAVMGGTACNGWRFWSLAGSLPPDGQAVREAAQATKPGRRPARPGPPVRAKKSARQKPVEAKLEATNRTAAFQRLPSSAEGGSASSAGGRPASGGGGNGDTPEGQARFFCSACMDAFTAPATTEPIGCPRGHSPKEQTAARTPEGAHGAASSDQEV